MKLTALLFAALALPLLAAPRLHVSTPTIEVGTEIEIVLDHEACPAERIGKVAATDWLEISPGWKGKTVWKEANVLSFVPEEVPALGTTYSFELIGEHVYLDGTPVSAGKLGTAKTPAPGVDYATMLDRWADGWSPRTARYYLRFNGEVDPQGAAPFFHYQSKEGRKVAATVRRATFGELKQPGYVQAGFEERYRKALSGEGEEPDLVPELEIATGLIVEPASPLPIGDEWHLVTRGGLPIGGREKPVESRRRVGDVDPFKIQKSWARTVADEPRRIVVDFTRDVAKAVAAGAVRVQPEVPEMELVVDDDELEIRGDFSAQDNWVVEIGREVASYDGLTLAEPYRQQLKFTRLAPGVGLASEDESQLASGSRLYRVSTVNIDSLRVRIKQLQGTQLIRARQGFRYYTGRGTNGDSLRPQRLMPYELMVGTTIADFEVPLDNAIDTSRELWIDWDKVLAGEAAPYEIGAAPKEPRKLESAAPGAFFVEIVGQPKDQASPRKPRSVQALVQLTDLGMAWKISSEEAKAFVFSCRTGEPLEGVRVQLFGEDAMPMGEVTTDAEGLAALPRDAGTRHLRASLGRDQFSAPFDEAMPSVGLWRFPVRTSWNAPGTETRETMLFTDRSLYRPQEMVRLKGIVRRQDGNAIHSDAAGAPRLTVTNPTGVEIVSTELKISENGSFDHAFRLPGETTGFHQIAVTWPEELKAAEEIENWRERSRMVGNARQTMTIRVEEFRRNAFELTHELEEPAPGAAEVSLDLAAANYNGQPLDGAQVEVWTDVTEANFYPDRFRDYLFGDHRRPDFTYWSHYFGYRWRDDHATNRSESGSEELQLDERGRAKVSASISEIEFPRMRRVMIQTEVTDANRQTLSKTSTTRVHPADVWVGVQRIDRLVRVGDTLPLEIVAVDPEGAAFTGELELTATLSREVNEQVRMRTPSGEAVRNEARDEELSNTTLTLAGGEPGAFVLTAEKPGRHTLELRGRDAQGRPFATATTVHVYGSDEYPWAYEDNMRIKLVPEKQLYRPGEKARVLVLSPIEGKALVTVERESVSRSFVTHLDPANPVIELPVTHREAPNCYVSVLVIKGAADSLRKFQEPQLRLGYCELTVENTRDRLAVEITGIEGEYSSEPVENELVALMPGSTATLSGRVLKSDGTPAVGAEVTLYAEDEGTLAVAGYTTPDPMAFFYRPRVLQVESGTSLGNFVPESPDEQTFFNKGLFIGGGDGYAAGALELPTRSDFDPCAFWYPALITGEDGSFTVEAALPDTLTRYRLIAVAHDGGAKFGHTEEAFLVNQPLMLEPQVPRFANEGDTLAMRATLRNASDMDGEWKVTLVPNPPASDPVAALAEGVGESQTLTLAAGEAATVRFDVDFQNTGEAVMNWRAEPVKLVGRVPTPDEFKRHGDAVESVFPVEYPVPLLRQTRLVRLDGKGGAVDLLDGLDPDLLAGRGHVEIELSRSLLLEAGGAVDYLLRYPYGCVEQTTSSLIPWLAVERLRAASPSLAKKTPEEVEKVIREGVDRLLGMQNRDGGFGYWTDAEQSSRWSSSYAGLALVLAGEQVEVPESSIERLRGYLTRQLREIDENTEAPLLEIAARDLWVLALAGEPQEAYVDVFSQRLPELTDRACCFLALAEVAGDRKDAARALLESGEPIPEPRGWWMRWQPNDALKLLAWSAIDPTSPEALAAFDKMLKDRNPYGHWRTTWVNAWALLGMAAYAGDETWEPTELAIDTGGDPEVIEVGTEAPVASRRFALHPGLKVGITADGPAFVRVSLASKPEIAPLQPVATNGLEVTRFYRRVHSDGSTEPLDVPQVGDLVRVDLEVAMPLDDARYLVIEDRLPGSFEAVNNSFATQAANTNAGGTSERSWDVSHSEIRADRVMFFLDRWTGKGTRTLSYLARVTLEGSAYAPPAKVEAMYDPDQVALSASRSFEVE